jgi:hypothetical protein
VRRGALSASLLGMGFSIGSVTSAVNAAGNATNNAWNDATSAASQAASTVTGGSGGSDAGNAAADATDKATDWLVNSPLLQNPTTPAAPAAIPIPTPPGATEAARHGVSSAGHHAASIFRHRF